MGVERQRGNRLGFWIFEKALKGCGLRGAYGLLYFVGLYYLIVDRPVVQASLAYLRRRYPGHGTLRQLWNAYLLFVSQGKSLIDRYAVAAGYDGIEVEIKGFEELSGLLSRPDQGFILLTAHVGNWQVAMTALQRFGRTVCLMMRPEDNAAVKDALNIYQEAEAVQIIYTDGALGGVVEAMRAINQGSLISIMGDRAYDFSATGAQFLGEEVRFPYGAFSLAAALKVPVVVLLSAKVGVKKYLVDVSHIIPAPAGTRGKREEELQAATQAFASILEGYVRDHPLQWFVFRDIWKSNT